MSGFRFSQWSLDRMLGVDERLITVAEHALQISKVDFGIPRYGGRRTIEEQRYLFMTDKSKADGVHNESFHQTGRALDFYAVDPETGLASWDEKLMTHVAAAFLQAATKLGVTVEWGGFWTSFVDMPHIQLPKD